ncbi:MAG: oxygenase MpaB family protein [Sphingobacteriales bacterium]
MENNNCNFFVTNDSIVRKIWGKADTILFIFAGASAEFALNQSVDWLYFTGKLPADPLGRLFSTVGYSRKIIFSETGEALKYIDQITAIHRGVEAARKANIPATAYLEVLYLLIDYSIRSFELLERKLEDGEKREVFDVFFRVGKRMDLAGLPHDYEAYLELRAKQLAENLQYGKYTPDLYKQYKKHLGAIRFVMLKQAQVLVVPAEVNRALSLGKTKWLLPVLYIYKFFRLVKLQNLLKYAILPSNYTKEVMALDHASH